MVVEIFAELVHQVYGLVFVLVAKAGEEVFDEPFVVFHHPVAVVLLLAFEVLEELIMGEHDEVTKEIGN